jgi:hypothetical protein
MPPTSDDIPATPGAGGTAFRAVVQRNGRTATGIVVPEEVVTALAAGRRPKVRATINGYTYRSSVASMDGRFLLPVSAEIRTAAGVAAGDAVDVRLEVDRDIRQVTIPSELATALNADADARRRFDALSYSGQLRYVLSVEGAKTEDRRRRRISKAVHGLRGDPMSEADDHR